MSLLRLTSQLPRHAPPWLSLGSLGDFARSPVKTSLIAIVLTGLLLSSCERKKPSEANAAIENTAVSAARADEDMLKTEIATGLEKHFNYWEIPVGDVEIMSGLSSQMENSDFKKKRFKEDYYKFLQYLQTKGLAVLGEQQQSELSAIGRMGARTVTVTPTEKAITPARKQVAIRPRNAQTGFQSKNQHV